MRLWWLLLGLAALSALWVTGLVGFWWAFLAAVFLWLSWLGRVAGGSW